MQMMGRFIWFWTGISGVVALTVSRSELRACGQAFYHPEEYTCYDEGFLCPILDGTPTLRCSRDCYLPSRYSCADGVLVNHIATPAASSSSTAPTSSSSAGACTEKATQFELNDPPYSNYFYSDCNSASQVVVTSPEPESNLTVIGPRLLIAWPGGNSGIVAFFAPQNAINGSLSISLVKQETSDAGGALTPIYDNSVSGPPVVGVSGQIHFNSSATLTIPILGGIRTIRDFTEGPSLLQDSIQDAMKFHQGDNAASITRLWFDNTTTSTLSFEAVDGKGNVSVRRRNLEFAKGTYYFNASYNYPQLESLGADKILADHDVAMGSNLADQVQSVSFLSYTDKLLAGAWRFLTYFGRDSMIYMLLMGQTLGAGPDSSWEAGISAVLERINKSDGSVAHEETIGDYATYLNLGEGISSTSPQYDYKMVDTDFYLPILLAEYFVKNNIGKNRISQFMSKKAFQDPENKGLSYRELATINAEKILNCSAAFAAKGGQKKENMIHLKEDQMVGEWRDSTYGIGGGRIPYDVNAALVPAGLRAIALLAENGIYSGHSEWKDIAYSRAGIWEDSTLPFFEVNVPQKDAKSMVIDYVKSNEFRFPTKTDTITTDVKFYALALDGNNNQKHVRVMNTDDCFRLFFLNTTNDSQLNAFLDQASDHILKPFPVGLSADIGLLVANPAYGNDPVYSANFTNSAYHGTVVWSWQLSMMAAGLERQLSRCSATDRPKFCGDLSLHKKVLAAYNHLWDVIEVNSATLSSEVWSWRYQNDKFVSVPLGSLPPPPGSSPTESDIRQLWSLTFLAVKRNKNIK